MGMKHKVTHKFVLKCPKCGAREVELDDCRGVDGDGLDRYDYTCKKCDKLFEVTISVYNFGFIIRT